MNGAFRAKSVQTVKYEVPTTILASATPVVVAAVVPEVPTSAPEPVVEVPVPASEPVVEVAASESVAVEVPTATPLEVEAPLEVLETAPESGLVPEDPPTE